MNNPTPKNNNKLSTTLPPNTSNRVGIAAIRAQGSDIASPLMIRCNCPTLGWNR